MTGAESVLVEEQELNFRMAHLLRGCCLNLFVAGITIVNNRYPVPGSKYLAY